MRLSGSSDDSMSRYPDDGSRKCFIAFSKSAPWAGDLLSACRQVLAQPEFNLEADHANRHLKTGVSLCEKALELILKSRFGIYDLSWWQDKEDQWHMPQNVYIELGMAIASNRPILLVCHANNRGNKPPAILEGISESMLVFGGISTLKHALTEHIRKWEVVDSTQDWRKSYCVLGNRNCEYRDVHPRKNHWGKKELYCYISDGPDPDRQDFRAVVENVLRKINMLSFAYLDNLSAVEGYPFWLCSHCQAARISSFEIFRITPNAPAATFINLGMSIALETQFGYKIPKLLIADDARDIPSLLRGYDIVIAQSDSEREEQLQTYIPELVSEIRKTVWKPRPLPFLNFKADVIENFTRTEVNRKTDSAPAFDMPLRNIGFIGRKDELADVLAGLQSGKTIVVHGSAGIGKTELVLEAAYQAIDLGMFPDGIFWSSGSDDNERDVLRRWTERAGPKVIKTIESEGVPPLFKSLMYNKKILIVLDGLTSTGNFRELTSYKDYPLLITTQVWPLDALDADIALKLDKLPRESSVELLRRALERSGLEARLTDEQADELAAASDDNPLVLARSASSVRMWSLETVLEKLRSATDSESFSVFFEKSYNQLTEEVQRVFRVMVALEDSVEKTFIETLTGLDTRTIEKAFGELAVASLIEVSSDNEAYRIHPKVMEVASVKLRSTVEWEAARERYDRYKQESKLLTLILDFEASLQSFVRIFLNSQPDEKLRMRYLQGSKPSSLDEIIDIIKNEKNIFEPLLREANTYSNLISARSKFIELRNNLTHSYGGIDLVKMHEIQSLVEASLPLLQQVEFSKPIKVTDGSFEELVLKSSLPVLVSFWAAWSGPSRMIAPFVEELVSDYRGQAQIAKMDMDANPLVSTKYGLMDVPTIIFFKDGEEFDRMVGIPRIPKEALRAKLDALLSLP